MSHLDERQGWGVRHPPEILVRTIFVHAVTIISYIHLEHLQKVRHSTRTARTLRLVLFALMPTLLGAEVIMNGSRIIGSFIKANRPGFFEAIYDWRLHLCALAGVRVAPKPGNAEVHIALLDNDGSTTEEAVPATVPYSPRLSRFQTSKDLQRHHQPWNFQVVLHILVLLLPLLQGVGNIVLFARRLQPSYYHWTSALDRRNVVAGTVSITCSGAAIIILLCRSEWSLDTLNASTIRQGDFVVRTFFLEILIASILNETPFWDLEAAMPISWILSVYKLLGLVAFVVLASLGCVAWFAIWKYDEAIKQRVTINWYILLGLPMALLTGWIFVDLVTYFVWDFAQLFTTASADYIWDRDPVWNYLPFCA